MISKNYIYSISLWLYASSIPLHSQELDTTQQTALTDYDAIADFDFDDDFLPYCLNNSNQDNHYAEQQSHNADNNPAALPLIPAIIATPDHHQNINLDTSSISDYYDDDDYFEESLQNNHQGNNLIITLSPEEIQQCKNEQIKVFNQTGDKKLAIKAYSKKYSTLRKAKPEYKEQDKLYKAKPEYKKQKSKYNRKYYNKKRNIDLKNPLQLIANNSNSIEDSNLILTHDDMNFDIESPRENAPENITHNITQQQPINNVSVLSLMPARISTQDHHQNIHFETSSTFDYDDDDFEESLPNNNISDHQGNIFNVKLTSQELQQCKDEQIKVFNQTGDKNLADQAYKKMHSKIYKAKPEYKEKEKLRIASHEYKEKQRIRRATPAYKEKQRLYKSKPEYKEKHRKDEKKRYYKKKHNIDLNNKLQTVVDNSRSIDTSHLETSSISDYYDDDYFEEFIDNNTI